MIKTISKVQDFKVRTYYEVLRSGGDKPQKFPLADSITC